MSKLSEMNTPIFWVEGHPGDFDKEKWKIEVSGLVERPKNYSWEELMAFQKVTVEARLTSVTRWSVRGRWGGICLADILRDVGALPDGKFVRVWSCGLVYDTSIPWDIAMKEKTLLAYEFDEEPLGEDYGGPIRLFVPYLWGYKSAKSVVKIEITEKYITGYWEKRGYTDSAKILPGRVLDVNTGKVRPIPGGEVIKFEDQ
ncbi:molybdopterin-dependent oxidoreductase [bacterium]|nr:molybdopterin-dependent oxidoreductase [bacterium]